MKIELHGPNVPRSYFSPTRVELQEICSKKPYWGVPVIYSLLPGGKPVFWPEPDGWVEIVEP